MVFHFLRFLIVGLYFVESLNANQVHKQKIAERFKKLKAAEEKSD